MKLEINLHSEIEFLSKIINDLYIVDSYARDLVSYYFHVENSKFHEIKLATYLDLESLINILYEYDIKYNVQSKNSIKVFFKEQSFIIKLFEDCGDNLESARNYAFTRNLTINSLMYHIDTKVMYDFTQYGIDDIKNKVIRPVGNIFCRFKEDPIRVLKFVRFNCQYGKKYADIDENTLAAIRYWKNIPGVSKKEIVNEFCKGVSDCQNIKDYLYCLYQLDLTSSIFNDLTINVFSIAKISTKDLATILSVLFLSSVNDVMKELRENWSKEISDKVALFKTLIDFKMNSDGYRFWIMRENLIDKNKPNNLQRYELLKNALEIAKISDLDNDYIKTIFNWTPETSYKSFPNLYGEQLGDAIKNGIREEFQKLKAA